MLNLVLCWFSCTKREKSKLYTEPNWLKIKYPQVPGVASLTRKLLVSCLVLSQHLRANRWSDLGSSKKQIVLKWMSYSCLVSRLVFFLILVFFRKIPILESCVDLEPGPQFADTCSWQIIFCPIWFVSQKRLFKLEVVVLGTQRFRKLNLMSNLF